MESSSFDRLAKRVRGLTTRRAITGAAAAALSSLLLLRTTTIEQHAIAKRGAGRRQEKLACRNDQSQCTTNDECCSGICKAKPGSGTEFRCVGNHKKKEKKKKDSGGIAPTPTPQPVWTFVSQVSGTQGSALTDLDGPYDVALSVDTKYMWIVDRMNSRIVSWSRPDTGTLTWDYSGGFGSNGSANDQFNEPRAIVLSYDTTEAWIVDTGNNRVTIWKRLNTYSSWQFSAKFGTTGSGDSEFSTPSGIALTGSANTAWVADRGNNRIVGWSRPNSGSTNWTYLAQFGSSGSGDSNFSSPNDVTVGPDTLTMWIADTGNNRVSIWTRATSGDPFTTSTTLNGFSSPKGLVLSSDGLTLYVTDFGANRVVAWARATTDGLWAPSATIASLGLNGPYGIAISANDRTLYVSDMFNNRVVEYHYS